MRDEPIEQVGHEGLLSIRGGEVVPSTKRIYRLTAWGQSPQSEFLWQDPLFRKLFAQAVSANIMEALKQMGIQIPEKPLTLDNRGPRPQK